MYVTGRSFRAEGFVRPRTRLCNRRVVFAEGEDVKVLRTVQAMSEELSETAILIGRPNVIESRIEREGLSIKAGIDFKFLPYC